MAVNKLVNGLASLALGSTLTEPPDSPNLARFAILDQAPADHHYSHQVLGPTNPDWSAHVKREHAILASSLPPMILVRAYEDRLDLLRALIVGPAGTPFANAPLLFDLRLPPATYPQSPPLVFFHSGSTRISPNLYENGMVCLSLLATWQGTHPCELWRGAASSILQVLVSIQGLILVRQPYFTEPGYERTKGTVQGERLSDKYDEDTFVLTRAFVKRACANPHPSFADELDALYLAGAGDAGVPLLKTVIEQVRGLIAESRREAVRGQETAGEEAAAVGVELRGRSGVVAGLRVLSAGASATLRGTLVGLEAVTREKGKSW